MHHASSLGHIDVGSVLMGYPMCHVNVNVKRYESAAIIWHVSYEYYSSIPAPIRSSPLPLPLPRAWRCLLPCQRRASCPCHLPLARDSAH